MMKMKTVFLLSIIYLLACLTVAHASKVGLYFTNGHWVGKKVTTKSLYGYDVCFVGNGWAAKAKIFKLIKKEFEFSHQFARYDKKKNVVYYGYVDTKCLDDSLDATLDSCRAIRSAPSCKNN